MAFVWDPETTQRDPVVSGETLEARLARLEERVRGIEEDLLVMRPRLHAIANAVNPMPLVVGSMEKHTEQLAELRSMVRAARWTVWILGPVLALITAATPWIVRATIRDAMGTMR